MISTERICRLLVDRVDKVDLCQSGQKDSEYDGGFVDTTVICIVCSMYDVYLRAYMYACVCAVVAMRSKWGDVSG